MGLSLRYNVSMQLIRMANEFTGDEIFMKKELVIPFTTGMVYKDIKPETEEQRRKICIDMLNKLFLERNRSNQRDYSAEARYYLEVTDYNLDKALAEYEADMKFEEQQKAQKTTKGRKHK